jgi:UDP-4-amino-4,6-dideoxy-N-acetyl-beta-L-altrosamine N-acetyltransferase
MISFIHSSYNESDFVYDNFINLSENELLEVLIWRNSEQTRKWMKNKNLISKESHLTYCKNLKSQNIVAHWRLSHKNRYVGIISVNEYFQENNSCEWGFYLSPQSLPEDSLIIFYAALNLFFEKISISILHGSVKTTNKSAVLLNNYFQFVEVETKISEEDSYSLLKLEQKNWLNRKVSLAQLITDFFKFYVLNKRYNANRQ